MRAMNLMAKLAKPLLAEHPNEIDAANLLATLRRSVTRPLPPPVGLTFERGVSFALEYGS